MKKEKLNYIEIFKDTSIIIIGIIFMVFATNVFLLPNKLSTGGASGVATIFYYIFNMPLGVTVLILNLPLFIIAIIKIGFKFSIKSILTTIAFSIFLDLFKFQDYFVNAHFDLFISSIFGGLLMGIGTSFTLKAGTSTGGSDLLAQIIYRLTSAQSVSTLMLSIDGTIILSIVLVFKNISLGLYSIVSIFISKKVIEIIFEGIYYTKIVNIITKNPDNMIYQIFDKLNRSATISKVIGAYTNNEYTELTVIVTLGEIVRLKKIISQNDPKALVYISNANEALGNGFKPM